MEARRDRWAELLATAIDQPLAGEPAGPLRLRRHKPLPGEAFSLFVDGNELFERAGWRLLSRIPVAHVIGAVLAAVSGALTGANIRNEPDFGRTDFITLCVYLAVAIPLVGFFSHKLFVRAVSWLLNDRAATDAERRLTLTFPVKVSAMSMAGWVGAALIWSFITSVHHGPSDTVRVALSIVLGGLTASGVTYLIAEWSIRPIVSLALATNVPDRPVAPGVRTKLLLSWAVGADVFLLMIGLSFVGRPANEPPSAAAIWFIIAAGLAAGSVVLYVATRSLVSPLIELRRSVGKVQKGDLEVNVPVNDGSELGLLQAGFNQMVLGLRERRTLQDLFGRQVGEEVARRALEQGVALGGDRREVGVVFVDLIDSTRLTWSESPEAVVELLNRFFGTIVKVVSAEKGWVNKFEGDGALCVFGAPVMIPDYAERALRAARTIRRELLALAAITPALDAAIGVSAGSVVAGNIGAEQRYEYTVIGTPVNEAARLTDEAKHRLGRVLASEEAAVRASGETKFWAVADEIKLRGHSEAILAYEPSKDMEAGRLTV